MKIGSKSLEVTVCKKFHLVTSSVVHFLPSALRHRNNKMKHEIICIPHLHNENVDVVLLASLSV